MDILSTPGEGNQADAAHFALHRFVFLVERQLPGIEASASQRAGHEWPTPVTVLQVPSRRNGGESRSSFLDMAGALRWLSSTIVPVGASRPDAGPILLTLVRPAVDKSVVGIVRNASLSSPIDLELI